MTTEEVAALLDRQRDGAARLLAAISAEFGGTSTLSRRCELAWAEAHRCAVVSVLHDDYGNAAAVLDGAVHAMGQAVEAVRRGELTQEAVATLLGGKR